MSHRQPRLKNQAAQLRKAFADKGLTIVQGEALELASRLNGYPSWNVAKQADVVCAASGPTTIDFQVWVGVHHHRHGQDFYYFTHLPTEMEVIEKINTVTDFEPDVNEWVEVLGVETFKVDVPEQLARLASKRMRPTLIGVYEICLTDLIDYDTPDKVPEWAWVESMASFSHKGNGTEAGVWEFMVHGDRLRNQLDEVPLLLRPEVDRALQHEAAWVMFHQG